MFFEDFKPFKPFKKLTRGTAAGPEPRGRLTG